MYFVPKKLRESPTDNRDMAKTFIAHHNMVPNHDKKFSNISNIRKWHLNDPVPLLITIKVDNLW